MSIYKKLVLTMALFLAFAIGCGEDDEPEGNGGQDTGADTGTGGGQDTSDTGTGAPVVGDILAPDPATGWIAGDTNPWGIQGGWFSYTDNESCDATDTDICGTSTITPVWNATGACATGEGAQVTGSMYSVFWGAGIGFNVCLNDNGTTDDTTDDVKGTLSNCTLADLSTILGWRITVTSPMAEADWPELRVTMSEEGRDESTYIVVEYANLGTPTDYLFADATVAYSSSAPAVDVTKINALQFQIATNTSAPAPFDFCIANIQAITP